MFSKRLHSKKSYLFDEETSESGFQRTKNTKNATNTGKLFEEMTVPGFQRTTKESIKSKQCKNAEKALCKSFEKSASLKGRRQFSYKKMVEKRRVATSRNTIISYRFYPKK